MSAVYKSAAGEQEIRSRYLELLKRWPVPNEQRRIATRQGETFVLVCGAADAPPLVLLHGSMANSAAWLFDIAIWTANFRVYCVDIIGEPGLSAPVRPALTSDAHALWLDDVLRGLSLSRISLVGVSLGGWIALDYATRWPDRIGSAALLCPAGIGKQKIGFLFKSIPLLMMGAWGQRKLSEMILGRAPGKLPPAVKPFAEFMSLVQRHSRPRSAGTMLPVFGDDALQRLTMPVLAIVGGKDVLLDSAATKRRLEQNASKAEVRFIAEAGHFFPGQAGEILRFLIAHRSE